MKKAIDNHPENGIQWINGKLGDLDYADDLGLLASSNPMMQRTTDNLKSVAESVGLRISIKKTKVMSINVKHPKNIVVDGNNLDHVHQFTYLGSTLTDENNVDKEVNIRIGRATATFKSLNKIWSSTVYSLTTKTRIYNSIVLSVLLYSSETWQLTVATRKRLDSYDNKCLRRILRINWWDHVRNEEVWRITKQPPVSKLICKRRLQLFGRIMRSDNDNLCKQAVNWTPHGRRKLGSHKMSWARTIRNDAKSMECSWEDVVKMTEDRNNWRVWSTQCAEKHGA